MRKKVDEESGYQYFYENFNVDKYGKIYLIAILINTPIEIGLQAALECSQNNYLFGRRSVELKLRGENGRKFNLRETTGTILPDSLYKSYDADGNEVYGYQILLEQQLPKPVSDKKFILRVFNHYLPVEENFLIVSEWYQKEGEGEFKYMRGVTPVQKFLAFHVLLCYNININNPLPPLVRGTTASSAGSYACGESVRPDVSSAVLVEAGTKHFLGLS